MSGGTKREERRQIFLERLRGILSNSQLLLPRLGEALTHPSYANETGLPDNQRLEFLGDAVLGLCVSEILTHRYPEADEGRLTRIRSALINAEALAAWGRKFGLADCIALGRGARAQNDRGQTNVVADAVEAVVASLYDAYGIDAARVLVLAIAKEQLESAGNVLETLDPKSELQERVQAHGFPSPIYQTTAMEGGTRDPLFTVDVVVKERVLASGTGKSKRLAERAAAAAALAGDVLKELLAKA